MFRRSTGDKCVRKWTVWDLRNRGEKEKSWSWKMFPSNGKISENPISGFQELRSYPKLWNVAQEVLRLINGPLSMSGLLRCGISFTGQIRNSTCVVSVWLKCLNCNYIASAELTPSMRICCSLSLLKFEYKHELNRWSSNEFCGLVLKLHILPELSFTVCRKGNEIVLSSPSCFCTKTTLKSKFDQWVAEAGQFIWSIITFFISDVSDMFPG